METSTCKNCSGVLILVSGKWWHGNMKWSCPITFAEPIDDPDVDLDPMVAKLYATDDAMVWAEEWCRIAREIEAADDGRKVIDEGWMVGWFANAMVIAVEKDRKRRPS